MTQSEAPAITPEELANVSDTIAKSSVGMKFGEVNICLKFHNGRLAKSTVAQTKNQQIEIG